MQIAIYSPKGGVGTSTLAYNIASDLNFLLHSIYDPTMKHHNIVYDLDISLSSKNIKVLKSSDLILIPTRLDLENIQATIQTINQLENYAPIIIIVNNFNQSVQNKYKNILQPIQQLQKELFMLKESESMRTSKNTGDLISQMHEKPYHTKYKIDSDFYTAYKELLRTIQTYQQQLEKAPSPSLNVMGRPPIKKSLKKTEKMGGYFTETESKDIKELSGIMGISTSNFIRNATLEHKEKHSP